MRDLEVGAAFEMVTSERGKYLKYLGKLLGVRVLSACLHPIAPHIRKWLFILEIGTKGLLEYD